MTKRLFGVVKGHREHIADHTGRLYSDSEVADLLNTVHEENEQLKQRINSRLHYYRELYNHFDKNDGFSYNIVERVVEDLEDILR